VKAIFLVEIEIDQENFFSKPKTQSRHHQKKYHLEFNETQLNALWNCIDNSNAPHSQVKDVEALIQAQLKSQLSDTTKVKK
jgi:hypothetical protein